VGQVGHLDPAVRPAALGSVLLPPELTALLAYPE